MNDVNNNTFFKNCNGGVAFQKELDHHHIHGTNGNNDDDDINYENLELNFDELYLDNNDKVEEYFVQQSPIANNFFLSPNHCRSQIHYNIQNITKKNEYQKNIQKKVDTFLLNNLSKCI